MRSRPLSTLLLYALLTLLYLYPLPFHLGDPASIAPDMFQNLWNFWWVKKALLDLHTSPYWTDYIFYPTGTSLAFQSLSPYNALLAIPLQAIGNRIVAYNLLYLASFALAGLGGYLLAFHFVRERYPAFLAGFIYAFSPYHFSRVMHINIASIQWIPLYALFLFRLRERPTWTHAVGAAVFLALTAMCSWYYLIFLAIFSVIYLLYYGVADRERVLNRRFCALLIAELALFLLLISPFALPLLREMATSRSYLYDPVHRGLDLLGISLFKGYIYFWPVYLGYTVLALSLYAIVRRRDRDVRFWLTLGLFSFLMTFGTSLNALGHEIRWVPLPYQFMEMIPIFRAARTPYRFLVLLMLSLSVLSAFGLRDLRARLSERRRPSRSAARRLAALLPLLAALEFLAVPRPTYRIHTPPFYATLGREEGDFALVLLPFRDKGWDMYYQTSHEKRIVWGYVSRRDPRAMEYLEKTPPFDLFLHPDRIEGEEITPDEIRREAGILRRLDFRYIVINKPKIYGDPRSLPRPGSTLNFIRVGLTPYFLNDALRRTMTEIEEMRSNIEITGAEISAFRDLLGRMCGEPFHEDDDVVVYRLDGAGPQ